MGRWRRGVGWLLLAGLAGAPCAADIRDASAQPTPDTKSVARTLATFGRQKYDAKEYAEALKAFKQAQSYYSAPTIDLYVARCHEKLGRLLEAKAAYELVGNTDLGDNPSADFIAAKQSAQTELAALKERIPTIRIEVTGKLPEQARFAIDGTPLTTTAIGTDVPLSVGAHVVEAWLPGKPALRREITLAERARERVIVEGEAPPPPPKPTVVVTAAPLATSAAPSVTVSAPPAPNGPSFWENRPIAGPAIVAGAGLALVGLGVGTGLVALDKTAILATQCTTDKRCSSAAPGAADALQTAQWTSYVSTGSFIAGGIALAAGVTWLVLPVKKTSNEVSIRWGLSDVAIQGRF